MPIKLIIFDVDGTLVDSGQDICNALNHAVKPYGIREATLTETLSFVGEGVTKLINKFLVKRSSSLDVSHIVERFLDYYSTHPADCTAVYPGIYETLALLGGSHKAVISNKTERLTRQVLEILNLDHFFECISGGDTFPQKKPSPEPIFAMLSRFHLSPLEAIMVGDSIYDIEAGNAAGIKTIAVDYGYGFQGFDSKADFTIGAFNLIPDIISKI
jgi:phosphoglycolate phosphatase